MNNYRKTFLAASVAILFIGVTLIASTQSHGATGSNTTVYPTGVFPTDVQNVQAAVNLGGTVLLKAVNTVGQPTAFNFGTPELLPGRRVLLMKDVSVVGEQVGSYMTTIQGGNSPIRCFVPVKIRIQGIHFEGPMGTPIGIFASTGADIVGNRINGVVPKPLGLGFTFGDGIDVFGNPRDPQNGITGKVRVVDNVIENLTADFAIGIQFDEVAADSEITGNTINLGPSIHDVEGEDIVVIRSHSSVLIDHNVLGHDMADAAIFIAGDHEARYHVSRNTVFCENPIADGILAVGGDFSEGTVGAVIEKNRVTMHNSLAGGISLNGLVTRSLVGENWIDGDGAFALLTAQGFIPGNLATSNRFQGNNISHFSSSVADVLFDTNTQDNVFLGHCTSVIDLGVNNQITCDTPRNANVLPDQIKNAHSRRGKSLKQFMSVDRRAIIINDN